LAAEAQAQTLKERKKRAAAATAVAALFQRSKRSKNERSELLQSPPKTELSRERNNFLTL
jgi:hypothetical protein